MTRLKRLSSDSCARVRKMFRHSVAKCSVGVTAGNSRAELALLDEVFIGSLAVKLSELGQAGTYLWFRLSLHGRTLSGPHFEERNRNGRNDEGHHAHEPDGRHYFA